jgi:hypothetical protein
MLKPCNLPSRYNFPTCPAAPLLVTSTSPAPEGEEVNSAWWSPKTDIKASLHLLTSSWLNVLLLTIPFAFASEYMHWNATTVFLLVSNACLGVQQLKMSLNVQASK